MVNIFPVLSILVYSATSQINLDLTQHGNVKVLEIGTIVISREWLHTFQGFGGIVISPCVAGIVLLCNSAHPQDPEWL